VHAVLEQRIEMKRTEFWPLPLPVHFYQAYQIYLVYQVPPWPAAYGGQRGLKVLFL